MVVRSRRDFVDREEDDEEEDGRAASDMIKGVVTKSSCDSCDSAVVMVVVVGSKTRGFRRNHE